MTVRLARHRTGWSRSNAPDPARMGCPRTIRADGEDMVSASPRRHASSMKFMLVSKEIFWKGAGCVLMPMRFRGLYPPCVRKREERRKGQSRREYEKETKVRYHDTQRDADTRTTREAT